MTDLVTGAIMEPLLGKPVALTWPGMTSLVAGVVGVSVAVGNRWPWYLRWVLYADVEFALQVAGLAHWEHAHYIHNSPQLDPTHRAVGLVACCVAAGVLLIRHYRRRAPAV